ncbi:hypothetical protein K439DRAFT_1373599 [Ramaria rubella]|nr:hypothetical protein K439DRAFT_1373599 [Ramaria rubella]
MAQSHPELFTTLPYSRFRINLPRHLIRPKYCPIDPGAIAAVDAVLEDIPIGYIQHTLKEIGPRLLEATCNATAEPPTGQLPHELELICKDVSIEPPSHILAVYSQNYAHVTLFPAHALILATYCAHLPALPTSKPNIPAASGDAVIVPVVPLRIPSTGTFSLLLSFLYTNRADTLMNQLIPVGDSQTMEPLTQKSRESLVNDARKVYGLWRNASSLGIFDDKLFQTLEMAWEVLLDALSTVSRQSLDAGLEVGMELE